MDMDIVVLGLPGLLLNKCFRILGWCTREIMMFYFCSVIIDIALVMGVPEDMNFHHARREAR